MIRRETHGSSSQLDWILIHQVEHAQLAGDLADAWNLDDLAADLQATLRWVARHHDDGWLDWDQHPGLDTGGRPIGFREMAVDEANAIWTRSIDLALDHGYDAAYLVARHFLDLRAGGQRGEQPAACQFRDTFQPRLDKWRQRWRANCHDSILTDEVVERSAELVQTFDWLSLLLCCGGLKANEAIRLPSSWVSARLQLIPQDEWRLSLQPWPFQVPSLQLTVHAWRVTARAYQNAYELEQNAQDVTLSWDLA